MSLVYLVRIGKHVKIGFTTNLEQRIKSFGTSTSQEITLLATLPGGRELEGCLHRILAELRLGRGEFSHCDGRIQIFAEFIKAGRMLDAWGWLEEMRAVRRAQSEAEDHRRREVERRQTKAELDAHFAALVAERTQRLGW